jgi:hypothetical protein
LFDRFAHDPDSILAVLRETTATMLARAQRLRGTTRCHRPSRAEPHIVLLVDELATLTAYADRKQRAEVEQLLGQPRPAGDALVINLPTAPATARPVCEALLDALARHGVPEQVLTDNGKVFTGRFGPGVSQRVKCQIGRQNS